jgi:hypothetical protein
LSGIGSKYDLYRFKRLKFNYVPGLPTSEEGNVYMGVDYNTLDPVPASSSDLCQLSHWSMNVVWKPSNLTIDLNSIGWLYTRSGPLANADYKTYDLGRLFFATEGINYLGICGYVEVEYDVEFKRRQPDYVTSVIPATDTYSPAIIVESTVNGNSNSTSFSSVISNNSILVADATTGTITTTKSVNVVVDHTGNSTTVYSSTDGTTFTEVASPGLGFYSFPMEVGKYYKIHNSYTTQPSQLCKLHITIISDL